VDFTPDQLKAIEAPSNVLVMAGAGTGKTRTLVEHCVRQLMEKDVSIDQVLMLTFTEAAASEMRDRIARRLQEKLTEEPFNEKLQAQIALVGAAQISTLHSYCYKLVREYFDQLDLDPGITVLTQDQATGLRIESFDELRDKFYSTESEIATAVRRFVESHAPFGEKKLRSIVESIHTFTQARPDPQKWIRDQTALHQTAAPANWRIWWEEGIRDWATLWRDCLWCEPEFNTNAHHCAELLAGLRNDANPGKVLQEIIERKGDGFWPEKKKGVCEKPMKKFFAEAAFFASLLETTEKDPLIEDWSWSRETALTLLTAAAEFTRIYDSRKGAIAAVDFHDLEQLVLKLLSSPSGSVSESACTIAAGLKWIYVDEYQDINPAQDRILRALHQPNVNLFMVGDVKQSIYRFRQAAPEIFQNYAKEWQRDPKRGAVVFLSANFRSTPEILDFNNRFFTQVMHDRLGGVVFDERAKLATGLPLPDADTPPARESKVELLLLQKIKEDSRENGSAPETEEGVETLDRNEQEAVIVAARLRKLYESGFEVMGESGQHRPFQWSDTVILLRAPRSKVESYAKVFENAGIPLQAKRLGFFASIEVLDLTNILTLLDNPLQDVPLLAALRSPMVGISVSDLAEIRIAAAREDLFWHAIQKFHRGKLDSELWRGVDRFLERYHRWRELSRHASLRERLQTIITETHYVEWLSIQPRGRQRIGNVEQLLAIAGEFDAIHRNGIYHFIRFIEDQQDAVGDIEPAGSEDQDAVRLMSIHQSKGLEFPVVVVGDLGKRFNLAGDSSGVLLTDRYGFATQVRPPSKRKSYDSLPAWLSRRNERLESIGEELRVLYVAMTRPQQKLILVGSASEKTIESWEEQCPEPLAYHRVGRSSNALDWLGRWLSLVRPGWSESEPDSSDDFLWQIHSELPDSKEAPGEQPSSRLSGIDLDALVDRINWKYPFREETMRRAKTSVSALRRQLAPDPDAQQERFVPDPPKRFAERAKQSLSAVEAGAATHAFLEHLDFNALGLTGWVDSQSARLLSSGLLSKEEIDAIDLNAIKAFWHSEIGKRLLPRADKLRREFPFTLRLPADRGYVLGALPAADEKSKSAQIHPTPSPSEAAAASLGDIAAVRQKSEIEDFVVVQGVIDLAMIDSNEIWLLDFKTDRIEASQLEDRVASYRPQMDIYKKALEEIYRIPVTQTWLHFLSVGKTVSL
jgi:ATP-dependent helicase/nuclease subunit A